MLYQTLQTWASLSTTIAILAKSAPSTLDTLNGLATARGNDPTFATTITSLTAAKQGMVTAAAPLSLARNALSIDLSAYQTVSSMTNYLTKSSASSTHQPILTAPVPLSLTSNTLSINLSACQPLYYS